MCNNMKEYTTISVNVYSTKKIDKMLNEMAEQGWILKCVSNHLCFLEREKN
jgi:hypothetical protein